VIFRIVLLSKTAPIFCEQDQMPINGTGVIALHRQRRRENENDSKRLEKTAAVPDSFFGALRLPYKLVAQL